MRRRVLAPQPGLLRLLDEGIGIPGWRRRRPPGPFGAWGRSAGALGRAGGAPQRGRARPAAPPPRGGARAPARRLRRAGPGARRRPGSFFSGDLRACLSHRSMTTLASALAESSARTASASFRASSHWSLAWRRLRLTEVLGDGLRSRVLRGQERPPSVQAPLGDGGEHLQDRLVVLARSGLLQVREPLGVLLLGRDRLLERTASAEPARPRGPGAPPAGRLASSPSRWPPWPRRGRARARQGRPGAGSSGAGWPAPAGGGAAGAARYGQRASASRRRRSSRRRGHRARRRRSRPDDQLPLRVHRRLQARTRRARSADEAQPHVAQLEHVAALQLDPLELDAVDPHAVGALEDRRRYSCSPSRMTLAWWREIDLWFRTMSFSCVRPITSEAPIEDELAAGEVGRGDHQPRAGGAAGAWSGNQALLGQASARGWSGPRRAATRAAARRPRPAGRRPAAAGDGPAGATRGRRGRHRRERRRHPRSAWSPSGRSARTISL